LYGGRVPKDDLLTEAYGSTEEAVAALGLARSLAGDVEIRGALLALQRELFVDGADLSTDPSSRGKLEPDVSLVTAAMVERLAPEWQSAVRQIDVATLKGKTSEDELFEVLWQKEDATSMLPAIALGNAASREKQRVRRLRVRFQGEEIVVDDSRTNIAIGRAEENDIVVKGNLI
jgi:hypothetical protein